MFNALVSYNVPSSCHVLARSPCGLRVGVRRMAGSQPGPACLAAATLPPVRAQLQHLRRKSCPPGREFSTPQSLGRPAVPRRGRLGPADGRAGVARPVRGHLSASDPASSPGGAGVCCSSTPTCSAPAPGLGPGRRRRWSRRWDGVVAGASAWVTAFWWSLRRGQSYTTKWAGPTSTLPPLLFPHRPMGGGRGRRRRGGHDRPANRWRCSSRHGGFSAA